MRISNPRVLKERTRGALAVAREPKKLILVYAGVLTLMSVLVTVISLYLDKEISGTGGLSNLGMRSILSTGQIVLPLAQSVIILCLDLGFQSAALRFARKQYADHTDLKTGFRHLAPLLRLSLLKMAMMMGILILCCDIGVYVFLMTPWANPLAEILAPAIDAVSGTINLDDATMAAAMVAMIPLMIMIFVIFAVVTIPLMYRFRMANYRLIDKPREGAIAALKNSWRMTKGNVMQLVKLDFSFWWYYLLTALASVVCYGDQILPMLGIQLPVNATVAYFLFYGAYLVMQFGIFYGFLNYVETANAMAYEGIRPQEKTDGVVLGNIFQM